MSIMVPLDTSDLSRSAVELAKDIARGIDQDLLLVTVADPHTRHGVGAFAYSEGQEPTDMLEAGLRTVADNLPDDLAVRVELLAGEEAAEALVRRADQDDVTMVVMASHGRTGYARWRMGSVADRVVRGATVPVTILPAPWRLELKEASARPE
ncbi:MAG: universal stress protein [Acidimicrobiia bacterium]|nr:universal stress protein [Acidimicrobiia bacterium]